MANLKDNGQRSKNAILLMWIAFGATGLMLLSEIYTINILNRIEQGSFLIEDLQMYTLTVSGSAIILVISLIVCAVFFIMWFRRAYYNLHQLVRGLKYSEGWAAGA